MQNISITPKTFTIDSVRIDTLNYSVNESATFSVLLCKEGGIPVESHRIEITGSEFDAWGSDDNYVIDLILAKLGLQKA